MQIGIARTGATHQGARVVASLVVAARQYLAVTLLLQSQKGHQRSLGVAECRGNVGRCMSTRRVGGKGSSGARCDWHSVSKLEGAEGEEHRSGGEEGVTGEHNESVIEGIMLRRPASKLYV